MALTFTFYGDTTPEQNNSIGGVFFDVTNNRFEGFVHIPETDTNEWRPISGGTLYDGDMNTYVKVDGVDDTKTPSSSSHPTKTMCRR